MKVLSCLVAPQNVHLTHVRIHQRSKGIILRRNFRIRSSSLHNHIIAITSKDRSFYFKVGSHCGQMCLS